MSFSVSAGYTSVTISYSGGSSGWTYDFTCGGSSRIGTSSTSATFSGLSEGTTYSWSGVAMNENGVPISWDSGSITTDSHSPSYNPETNATMSLSSTWSSITAQITGLTPSCLYGRYVIITAVASSGGSKSVRFDIAAGDTNPDFQKSITELAENTLYYISAVIYAADGTLIKTLTDSIKTDKRPATFDAYLFDNSTICAAWSNFQSVNYSRRIVYELSRSGVVITTKEKTVTSSATGDLTNFYNLPNGTYSVTSRVYHATNGVLFRTETISGIVVSQGLSSTFSAYVLDGVPSIRYDWEDIAYASYNRTFITTLYKSNSEWDSNTYTLETGNYTKDFGGVFSNLPSGTYSITSNVYNSNTNALVNSQTISNLIVFSTKLVVTAISSNEVEVTLTNIAPASYNRSFRFELYQGSTYIDFISRSRSKTTGAPPDLSVVFSYLTPNTSYRIDCNETNIGNEHYTISFTTLKGGAEVWIYSENQWKKAIPYIYSGNQWKEASPKIYNNGNWKPL